MSLTQIRCEKTKRRTFTVDEGLADLEAMRLRGKGWDVRDIGGRDVIGWCTGCGRPLLEGEEFNYDFETGHLCPVCFEESLSSGVEDEH